MRIRNNRTRKKGFEDYYPPVGSSPWRRRLALLLCVVAAIWGYALFRFSASFLNREIEFGAVLPLTGSRAKFGQAMKNGIDMAVNDINSRKVLKKKLVCHFSDDGSDPVQAAAAAGALIKKGRIVAIIGSYSNLCTLAVAEAAEKAKIPLISPISSGEEISTRGYGWVFRLNGPTSHYAFTLLDFLTSAGGVRTIALIHETDHAGNEFARFIEKYAADMNCPIVYTKGFPNRTADFGPILTEAGRKGPGALVMYAHIEDAVQIMKAARRQKVGVKAFAGMGSGFSLPDFISQGGPDAERTFSVVHWNSQVNWEGAREFARAYRERFGILPDEHSASLYAAVQVLAACCAGRQDISRKELRQELQNIHTQTVYGEVRFENYAEFSNQNSHYPLVQQVREGRNIIVWPRAQQAAPPLFGSPAPGK